jgi:hypothetical protein
MKITRARILPVAMVQAKSKLIIMTKVLKPDVLIRTISPTKITMKLSTTMLIVST